MNENYFATLSHVPGVLLGCIKSNLSSCKEITHIWIVNALVFITENEKKEKGGKKIPPKQQNLSAPPNELEEFEL